MANINDAYDPTFANDPNYVWDSATSSWQQKGAVTNTQAESPETVAARQSNPFNNAAGNVQQGNKDPFAGGDLFAPDLYAAKGRPIDAKAFGPTDKMNALKGLIAGGINTPATGETLNTGAAERARGSQEGLLQQLLDMAAGKTQSPAQMLLQQGADRNMADAAALTNSTRGMGATAAAGQVAGQRAQIGQETTRDMGILRLQEQMQATQAASQVAQGLRGQDIGQEQARAQVGLARDSLNASVKQKYIDMGLSAEEADRRAAMDLQKLETEQALAITGLNQKEFARGEGQRRDDFGTFLKSIGGVGDFIMSLASMGSGKAPAK
jgi:hypothetical protein